jgi:hypothetical protein
MAEQIYVVTGASFLAKLVERHGEWAIVELPSKPIRIARLLSITHLVTGMQVAFVQPDQADAFRPALRELGELPPFGLQDHDMRERIVAVLEKHDLWSRRDQGSVDHV